MSIQDKTWIAVGLAVVTLFEFFSAMYVFGRKPTKERPKKHLKLFLRLHRVFGYVFAVWFLWLVWIGVDLLQRMAEQHRLSQPEGLDWGFTGRIFYHAMLAVVVFLLLLLKLGFVRIWTNYRQQARLLGFLITVGTLTIILIAGWFFAIITGGTMAGG